MTEKDMDVTLPIELLHVLIQLLMKPVKLVFFLIITFSVFYWTTLVDGIGRLRRTPTQSGPEEATRNN